MVVSMIFERSFKAMVWVPSGGAPAAPAKDSASGAPAPLEAGGQVASDDLIEPAVIADRDAQRAALAHWPVEPAAQSESGRPHAREPGADPRITHARDAPGAAGVRNRAEMRARPGVHPPRRGEDRALIERGRAERGAIVRIAQL